MSARSSVRKDAERYRILREAEFDTRQLFDRSNIADASDDYVVSADMMFHSDALDSILDAAIARASQAVKS